MIIHCTVCFNKPPAYRIIYRIEQAEQTLRKTTLYVQNHLQHSTAQHSTVQYRYSCSIGHENIAYNSHRRLGMTEQWLAHEITAMVH
jgi:hypothetical protein